MTAPFSGESSVLDTYLLISDGFFLFQQTKTKVSSDLSGTKSEQESATADSSFGEHGHQNQMRASRLVVRRRMVFWVRSWLARMKRTVRLFARIKIEWVMAVAPWERTPRKSALSLMPVAQKTMFFPLARSSAE